MLDATGLRWIITLVAAGTGGWFLFRAARPETTEASPGGGERINHLAHALMAAAMVAMAWMMGPTMGSM